LSLIVAMNPGKLASKGKIDFLFVISALGTMRHEQDQLLENAGGFSLLQAARIAAAASRRRRTWEE